MKRLVSLIVFAAVLVLAGWSAGRAQARIASFYVTIDAPSGDLKITCSQGCEWPSTPGQTGHVIVTRCERQPCRVMFNGNGRVRLEAPH